MVPKGPTAFWCLPAKCWLWFLTINWIIQCVWALFITIFIGIIWGYWYWIISELIVLGTLIPPIVAFF